MIGKLSLMLVSALAINAFANGDISLKYGLTSLENKDSMKFENSTFMIDGTYDLGFSIKPRAEFNYIKVDDKAKWGGVSSLMQFTLNGQYDIKDLGYGLSSYLFGGVGYESVSDGTDVFDSNPFLQAGLGLKYAVNEKLNIVGEVKAQQIIDGNNESDDEDNEFLFALGVNFPLQSQVPAPAAPIVAAATTPAPEPVVEVADSDKDGVPDNIDECPGTVLKDGMSVNEKGCEVIILQDSDNDGVTDDVDACPNTPEGTKVDNSGCGATINLHINFDTNKATIKPESMIKIKEFATYLKSLPDTTVVIIEGYTDSSGNEAKNRQLSSARAFAVRKALIKEGIRKSRVRAYGKGSANPIASNDTPEGRAKNRRIEATIQR